MPTTVTSKIGATNSPVTMDYTTLQAWEDACPSNLVTDDKIWRGECYNQGELIVAGAVLSISGITTDSTRYIELTTAAGASFRDHATASNNELKYDITKGVGIKCTGTYVIPIAIAVANTRISKLQFTSTQGALLSHLINVQAVSGCIISDIICQGVIRNNNCMVIIWNGKLINSALIVTGASVSRGGIQVTGSAEVYGCTIVLTSNNTPTGVAIDKVYGGTATIKNCAIFGWGTLVSGTTVTGSYNASDLTVTFGTNNQSGLTYTSQFIGTTSSNPDFRIKAGSNLIRAGVADTTNYPNDIIGNVRSNIPSIGAWEFISKFIAYTDNLAARQAWWSTATRELSSSAFPGYSNIVAYWPLNGDYFDYIGSNHLTPSNSPVFTTGKLGNGLDLESGSSQAAIIADNSTVSVSDILFSFACWVNAESLGADRAIFSKMNAGGTQMDYTLRFRNSDNRFQWRVTSDGATVTDVNANNLGAPSTSTWYFIVCWHNSTTNEVGISVNAGTANTASHSTGVFDGNGSFALGKEGDRATDYWDGIIDEVIMWKGYIPDSTEIAYLYNSGNGRSLISSSSNYEANIIAKAIWESVSRTESTLPSFYSGFARRKPLLFKGDKVTGLITDYPKLITINSDSDISNALSATKLAVTNYAGTLVPHGLYPSSVPASGTILARVKTTLVENTDSFVFLHYDDGGVDQENKPGTVSNAYALFMPMEESPSGVAPQIRDWVSNSGLGTSNGTMLAADSVSGVVGRSINFDGFSDYIETVTYPTLPIFTVEAWTKANSYGSAQICNKYDGAGFGFNWYFRPGGNSGFDDGSNFREITCTAPASGVWGLSVLYYDGTNLGNYLNGSLTTSAVRTGPPNNASSPITIGRQPGGTDWLNGQIDEIRISSVARSGNWLAYAYTDDFDNTNTFLVGTEDNNIVIYTSYTRKHFNPFNSFIKGN